MKNRNIIRVLNICITVLLCAAGTNAQTRTTIHILHPWADDPARVVYPPYVISAETGWYPGTPMNAEGGDWYTYTFVKLNRTTNDRMEFASYIPSQYNRYGDPAQFPSGQQLVFKTVFAGQSADINEVWIIPSATGAPKLLFSPPPGGKVIFFLNPWNLGAPRIRVGGYGIAAMQPDRRSDRCSWFFYHYYGPADSLAVSFMNSLDSTWYGQAGFTGTTPVDLVGALAASDSVWIHATLPGDSTAIISLKYPGISGLCSRTIELAAIMRDIGLHPDFGTYPELADDSCGGLQRGMVEKKLGPDGKPVKKAHRCTGLHSRFDWFDTKVLVDNYTNETCYNLTLATNEEGIYEYDTDYFFPLDSFIYLDPQRTIRNPNNNLFIDSDNPPPANVHFTMELTAQFEYHKGQTFYFRGDDDVWVFIDSQLVVDLGGNHGPEEGSVNLDKLGLTPGVTYSFKLFFTERNCCGSNFRMQTSINLTSTSRMFWIKSIPAAGRMQFDLYERVSHSSVSCNPTEGDVDTVNAQAQFLIEGPQFTGQQELRAGLSYGGIYISNDLHVLVLDTTAMTGLETGFYTVTFQLLSDPSQHARISFSVIKPPKPDLVQNPVIAAAYFADNGIGSVTRAEIFYTNALTRLPDSIVLYWPEPINNNRRVVVPGNGITVDTADPRHLTAVPPQPFDSCNTVFKGTTGLGTSFIHDTTYSQPNDIARFNIADSVGPLLTSALRVERDGATGPDTFFLTFSEPLNEPAVIGKSLLLKPAVSAETTLTVLSYSVRLDTIIVLTEAVALPPADGDSLRISPAGPLVDQSGNHAHPLNRAVPVLIRKAAANVVEAYYCDRDADGIVDAATFITDRAIDMNECAVAITWIRGISASGLSGARLQYGSADSTVLQVDLAGAFSAAVPVATGGLMTYRLTISSSTVTVRSGSCSDSAAPVLSSASFHPALFTAGPTGTLPDTLLVTFSEDIAGITSELPFLFLKPGTDPTTPGLQVLRHEAASVVFLFTSALSDVQYPADGDSIAINPSAGIADTPGTGQENAANRRVPLEVVTVLPHFRIIGAPNPFNPSSGQFMMRVDPYVRSKGLLSYRIHLRIYDKAGSLVTEKVWPESSGGFATAETVFWNGTNRRGRIVGNGTYLGHVRITDENGANLDGGRVHEIKIGVARKKNGS